MNIDGIVDRRDYALVNYAIGSARGTRCHQANLDVNNGGITDAMDLAIVSGNI